jgi:hypothetical protein
MSTVPGLHRITAEVARPDDRSLPLRVVSLMHRRAVHLLELRWEVPDGPAGADPAAASCGRVHVVFRSSEQAARLVCSGLESMVDILDPVLDVDVCPALDRA